LSLLARSELPIQLQVTVPELLVAAEQYPTRNTVPLLDITLHGNFRRHPVIGAGIQIKMPRPFIFDRHQLIDVHGTAVEDDTLIVSGNALARHAYAAGAFRGLDIGIGVGGFWHSNVS